MNSLNRCLTIIVHCIGLIFFFIPLHSCNAYNITPSSESQLYPRDIWMYYSQNLNEGLKTVLNITWTTLSKNWTMHYLTDSNLSNYIDKQDFPPYYMKLHPVHRSDYLRVYLLYRYGGWYLDFSTLVTSNSYFEVLYQKMLASRIQFLAFGPDVSVLHEFSTNVLYAPEGSLYASLWFEQVHKLWEIGNLNYVY